ncbi:MAG: carbohydrate kinase family protein [bacterium]
MKYDILTIGDALEDVFVEPELKVRADQSVLSGKSMNLEFGEKIPLNWVNFEIGGSACNAAVGFERLGAKSCIIAMCGDDDPKDKVIKRLRSEKVDCSNIIVNKHYQTGYSVVLSVKGERTILVFHGPKDYSKIKIDRNIETEWLYLAPLGHNTDELEKDIVSFAAEKDVKIGWNPGSIQIKQGVNHWKHVLRCTNILFLNKEEALKFLGTPVRLEMREILKRLHAYGPKIVVVTNGKEGAVAYDGVEFNAAKPDLRVEKVDATGAGDSFAIGFLARLMNADWRLGVTPDEIREALNWGIKNSNSVIQYIGAQRGLLTLAQMKR